MKSDTRGARAGTSTASGAAARYIYSDIYSTGAGAGCACMAPPAGLALNRPRRVVLRSESCSCTCGSEQLIGSERLAAILLERPNSSMSDRRPPKADAKGWSWAQRKAAMLMYVLLRSLHGHSLQDSPLYLHPTQSVLAETATLSEQVSFVHGRDRR